MHILSSPVRRLVSGAVAPLRGLVAAVSVLLAACGGGGGGSAGGGTPVPPPAVTVTIGATPITATTGQTITLNWSAQNASSCVASGAWSGQVATSGSQAVVAPAPGTVSYTLTCNGVAGSASVAVSAPVAGAPTVSVALAPASVNAGQSARLSWSSTGATSCTASGAWSGTRATAGTLAVSQTAAGTYPYTLSCSGAGGNASGSAVLAVTAGVNNSVGLIVDGGPAGVPAGSVINVPYVTVTICKPGTAICQTIDHVLVDTGSFGLRVLVPLDAALALPAVHTPSGADAGECAQFVSGYEWGAVRQADVLLGGEIAASLPIHVVNDPSAEFAAAPTSCSRVGSNLGTVSALGANGVLGIGLFRQDCGAACADSAISGAYYACGSGGCAPSVMPLAQQVGNPVAGFATDNNGVLVVFPTVPSGGRTSLSGSLIFGIGTQSNNAIGSEKVYSTDNNGNFRTLYKGVAMNNSFLDSGSNGLFFNDNTMTRCSQGSEFYCPSSTLNLSAVNTSSDGTTQATINFSLDNFDNLPPSVDAANIGGTNGAGAFDWGLPFFFGRRVFVAIEDGATPQGTGPYWAY